MKTNTQRRLELIAELKRLQQYGFDPYDSNSGAEWYSVATTLGLPL